MQVFMYEYKYYSHNFIFKNCFNSQNRTNIIAAKLFTNLFQKNKT